MEDKFDGDIGKIIASKLLDGDRLCYNKMQALVRNAMKTQDWIYGDMVMHVVWALLPKEAQAKIAASEVDFSTPYIPPGKMRVRKFLVARIGDDAYSTWFNSMKIEESGGETVLVSFPVKFIVTWVQSHYLEDLLACLRAVYPKTERVVVRQSALAYGL